MAGKRWNCVSWHRLAGDSSRLTNEGGWGEREDDMMFHEWVADEKSAVDMGWQRMEKLATGEWQ
jgi:hypothetical protein